METHSCWGDTPVVRLPRLMEALKPKGEVVAKLEFFNPIGSVKDRSASSLRKLLGPPLLCFLPPKGTRRSRARADSIPFSAHLQL